MIGGRYELLELLGAGGAARVFRAHDRVLDRIVAVKLLRAEYGTDPDFVARFQREARAVAALSHPNIVEVYDYGAFADTYFIAMQYIEGTDLKAILRREGRLAPHRAVALVSGVLRGLGAAHEHGLIHRDVKPQNVLVRASDGLVKFTDFGVARAVGAAQRTADGTVFGTAHYMAPEQATGAAVGPPADLYAAAVVLYEALAGPPAVRGRDDPGDYGATSARAGALAKRGCPAGAACPRQGRGAGARQGPGGALPARRGLAPRHRSGGWR